MHSAPPPDMAFLCPEPEPPRMAWYNAARLLAVAALAFWGVVAVAMCAQLGLL